MSFHGLCSSLLVYVLFEIISLMCGVNIVHEGCEILDMQSRGGGLNRATPTIKWGIGIYCRAIRIEQP